MLLGGQAGGGGNAVRIHPADNRFEAANADHERQPVGNNCEQKIECRTGDDDSDALPQWLSIEGPVALVLGHLTLVLVEHLDVAAQRNHRDDVLGLIRSRLPAPQGAPETQGESEHLDAEAPSDPEVAELVHGHQHTDGD